MGSHNLPTRPKHRLFVRTSVRPRSFFFRVNLSVCLSHRRPSRSVDRSSLDWSISVWLECQVLIWKWPFSRMASMSLIICSAFAVVALDPPISSTYAWSWSSFAASGNSACDNFARVLMALVAMSGAGLSPKFNLSHWYTVGESFVLLLHRNLW